MRVSRLRQVCSELSIIAPRQTSVHDQGASKYAFILTDDIHKASINRSFILAALQQLHRLVLTFSIEVGMLIQQQRHL